MSVRVFTAKDDWMEELRGREKFVLVQQRACMWGSALTSPTSTAKSGDRTLCPLKKVPDKGIGVMCFPILQNSNFS